MGVTRLAINRPIAILMLMLAFFVLGAISFTKLPKELNPQVDFGVVTVVTTYAGTNPQEMETLITKPIEDSISGVSGLKEITSTSQQGVSVVSCQFYIGTNMDTAASDLREKVDAVRQRLPSQADSPAITKQDTSAQPVMYIAMSGKRTPRELRVLADNVISERLQTVPDVAAVNVLGGDKREIRVSVKRERLAAYGITIGQLSTAIQQANSNISAGQIQKNDQYASIRFLGEFTNVGELNNLRVSIPSNNAGSTGTSTGTANSGTSTPRVIRLSDIASVNDTTVERTVSSTLDGRDAVTLAIQKTSDGNTLNACSGIKKQLLTLQKSLPSDVKFTYTMDTSKRVTDNLNDVVVSLLLGAVFAIFIVYLFLHNFRATVIVAIAIPACVISTFLPISSLGFTLNTMTLLGLSLSIGILIDDSIVVLENIVRHLKMGESPVQAAINGRSEIGMAALTLTAVDLVVFIPIAFMSGIIGQFFRSFGASISIAVATSLFVSFTVTPMLAARWFKTGESLENEGGRGFFASFDRNYNRFREGYRRFLGACIRRPWLVVIVGNAVLLLVMFNVAPKLGFRFAPGQDQNLVQVLIEGPAGSSLAYTQRIATEVERRIRADQSLKGDIKYLLTATGQSQSGGAGAGYTGTQYGNMQVSLYEKAAPLDKVMFWNHGKVNGEPLRDEADTAVAAKIRNLVKTIPGAKIQAFEVNGFGGGGAPLTINLTGTDFNQILAAANTIRAEITKVPGVYNTDISFKASQPEVQIRLDRTRAAEYGLSLDQVAQAVSMAMQGDTTSKFRDPIDNEQYDIRVELSDTDRQNTYTVGNIPVAYQGSNPVLLGDVANISMGAGPTRVDRLNRERKVAVTGYLMPGTQIGNVRAKVDPGLQDMQKAGKLGNVTYNWGGEAQSLSDEGPFLFGAILLGIALSYMLMAALFNNMLYPLSVMLTLPQALVGALMALLITGTPLSLIAMIGVIMLNGLAAKNAILMVDYINTLRSRGYNRIDAILEAAPTRLRPILMTSAAIICATLPTALGLGRGAGFRQPLGIVVVGGIIVSTLLTLVVIPCSYLLFDNFSNFINRRRGKVSTDDGAGPSPDGHGTVEFASAGNGLGKAGGTDGTKHNGSGHGNPNVASDGNHGQSIGARAAREAPEDLEPGGVS